MHIHPSELGKLTKFPDLLCLVIDKQITLLLSGLPDGQQLVETETFLFASPLSFLLFIFRYPHLSVVSLIFSNSVWS